ncbi:unnamed protein product, partial [Mesorhabditis spiculigera]
MTLFEGLFQSTDRFTTKFQESLERLQSLARMEESPTQLETTKRQYLVPAEEIHCTLEVVPVDDQPHVHKVEHRDEERCIETTNSTLRRAQSTESVDSTASSLMEVNQDIPSVSLTLTYDLPSQMLSCQIHSLQDCPVDGAQLWMLFFLLPHSKPLWRTEAVKLNSPYIEYHSIYQQCVRRSDLSKIALLVQLYSSHGLSANVVGSCRLRIKDLELNMGPTLSLTLAPNRTRSPMDEFSPVSLGEILFLVNFAADRLSIVLSKVRHLDGSYTDAFIRVYVVQPMGKVLKKKTSTRKLEAGSASFMESLFVPIPRQKLMKSHIRLSVVCSDKNGGPPRSMGHVTLGPKTAGRELGQWLRIGRGEQTQQASWHHIRPRATAF